MDAGNRILQESFRAMVADALRRGFVQPFRVLITDGDGGALGPDDDGKTVHRFPLKLSLTSADNRTAELVIDEPEPVKPAYVQ